MNSAVSNKANYQKCSPGQDVLDEFLKRKITEEESNKTGGLPNENNILSELNTLSKVDGLADDPFDRFLENVMKSESLSFEEKKYYLDEAAFIYESKALQVEMECCNPDLEIILFNSVNGFKNRVSTLKGLLPDKVNVFANLLQWADGLDKLKNLLSYPVITENFKIVDIDGQHFIHSKHSWVTALYKTLLDNEMIPELEISKVFAVQGKPSTRLRTPPDYDKKLNTIQKIIHKIQIV